MQRLSVVRLSALFVVLLIGASLLAPDRAAGAKAGALAVAATPATPWPGEVVRLTGKVPPQKRPVVLQKYASGRWVNAARTTARAGGAFTFSVRATTTRTGYRVSAPKARVGGRSYPARLSAVRYVLGRTPKISLAFAPAPVGRQVSGDLFNTPGRVVASPARPGAAVVVQRQTATGWTTVASGTQDRVGAFGFQLNPGASAYRAVASTPGVSRKYTSASVRATAWSLRWRDEMDPSKPTNAWIPRQVGERGERRICSTTGANQVSYGTVGGVTRMRLTFAKDTSLAAAQLKDGCPEGTYLNAMVGTDTTKKFTYGVFAARVRFQAPRGLHGAFWLQANLDGTPEIDTAEYFGDGRPDGGIANFLHPRNASLASVGGIRPEAKAEFARQGTTPSAGYHVYSVEWTSTGYVFRLDGVETLRTSAHRSADPHYLVLSLLGSDWELPALPKNSLGQPDLSQTNMDVDWVRVWQQ